MDYHSYPNDMTCFLCVAGLVITTSSNSVPGRRSYYGIQNKINGFLNQMVLISFARPQH